VHSREAIDWQLHAPNIEQDIDPHRRSKTFERNEKPMAFGRYFEEFKVGETIKHWPGRTITEFDDTWFSLMTMNQHPLHIDENYARTTQHGQRLVNGTLVFSLVVGMSVADISGRAIANLEYEEVKHLGPVFHGDSIYAVSVVLDMRESKSKPDRGVVYIQTKGYNQKEEVVLTLKRKVLVPKKPGEASNASK
jgi:acyl dehydratase